MFGTFARRWILGDRLQRAAVLAGVTCLAGLVLTGAGVFWAERAREQDAGDHFENLCRRATTEIAGRMRAFQFGLAGTRGLFAASDHVDESEFKSYADSRDLLREFHGARAIGFIERMAERESASGEVRAEVRYIEPHVSHAELRGRKLEEEPAWQAAAERAMRSGEPTLARSQRLAAGEPLTKLYMLAWYDTAVTPREEAERLARCRGWVFFAMCPATVLGDVEAMTGHEVAVDIEDITDAEDRHVVLSAREAAAADPLVREELLQLGGRRWRVTLWTTPRFAAKITSSPVVKTAAVGMVVTALLSALVWHIAGARERATALARAMTADLQEQKERAENAARELGALKHVVDRHALVSVTDARGRIIDANESFLKLSGYTREELIGQTHRIVNSGHHPKSFWVDMWRTVTTGKVWQRQVCNRAKDGSLYWVDATVMPFRDHTGAISKYVAVRTNITPLKEAERTQRYLSMHDPLTGLPNRMLLLDRLRHRLEQFRRDGGRAFALLFLDFDRFKLINDSLGHDAGDQLLREISSRLRNTLRATDTISFDTGDGDTAARLGGDEFVVILDEVDGQAGARTAAQRLLSALAAPYRIGGLEVVSTASIGVVTSDHFTDEQKGGDADAILRDADAAMYEAKLAGKARYVFFDGRMRQRAQRRLALESELRHALERGEMHLAYQPVVTLDSGKIVAAEALLRWRHPVHGAISPGEFIPIAEETGLIIPMGEWVVEQACAQLAAWHKTDPNHPVRSINVNVSRAQLSLHDLPQRVAAVLEKTGVNPSCLRLEITEGDVVGARSDMSSALHALKAIGVSLAMDDFGTGLSSLSGISQLPFDVIKMDRSFVANLGRGRHLLAIGQTIVELARHLGMATVAEGLETKEQVAVLQSLSCEYGQGFYFARPMSAAEFEAHLRGQQLQAA